MILVLLLFKIFGDINPKWALTKMTIPKSKGVFAVFQDLAQTSD
jgi:hypothetical protein